jgi:hypothetical protein
MLGIKALKVLPNIPFAPGHKLVLFTPLYVVATLQTRAEAGATLAGLTMGTTAFLMGDGKYGVFEVIKHVVARRAVRSAGAAGGAQQRRPWVWAILGGVIAAGRFATIFLITLLVQAPAIAFAILHPRPHGARRLRRGLGLDHPPHRARPIREVEAQPPTKSTKSTRARAAEGDRA